MNWELQYFANKFFPWWRYRHHRPHRPFGITNQTDNFACLWKYQPIRAWWSDPEAGVCMKVRFKSKVTRGISFSPRRVATRVHRFALRGSFAALSCREKSRKTSRAMVFTSNKRNKISSCINCHLTLKRRPDCYIVFFQTKGIFITQSLKLS